MSAQNKVNTWLSKAARKGGKSIRNVLKPSGAAPTTAPLATETVELMAKAAEKVLGLFKIKRLMPRNCPPFLPDVLANLLKVVGDIKKAQVEPSEEANRYLRHFTMVFLEKTKAIARILKSESSKVLREERSQSWRTITRMTLTLLHNLHDIKAMFPSNKYITEWRFAKAKADDFWRDHFDKMAFVPWEEFSNAFTKVHPVGSTEELGALWRMMDMTDTGCISWFEFDIFTRLFQPWTNIIDNWKVLTVAHPAYKSSITYSEMNNILERLRTKPGSYMYRVSATKPGSWVVGYVSRRGLVVQTQPQNKAMFQTLIDFSEDRTCIYPCGQPENPDIRRKVNVDVTEYVKVTDEEEEMYMAMGTTFELCKICANNNKNLRINPCGHMMCNECLNDWTKTGGKVCPFCRDDIIDIDEIVVEAANIKDKDTADSADAQNADLPAADENKEMVGAVSAILHYDDDDADTGNDDNNGSDSEEEEEGSMRQRHATLYSEANQMMAELSFSDSQPPPIPDRGSRDMLGRRQ